MEPLIKERRELVTEGKRNDLIFSHMFGMFTWEIKKKNQNKTKKTHKTLELLFQQTLGYFKSNRQ